MYYMQLNFISLNKIVAYIFVLLLTGCSINNIPPPVLPNNVSCNNGNLCCYDPKTQMNIEVCESNSFFNELQVHLRYRY